MNVNASDGLKVSFAIQSHPLRQEMAEALAADIGGDVEIVSDPEPDVRLKSPWRTYRHLLQGTPGDATHRFQIQDDAVVCQGFRAAVEAAVAARPGRLLIFFVGGNPVHHAAAVIEACRRDEAWAELNYAHWCPAVATCWPAALIPQLMEFVESQNYPPGFVSDDEIIGRFIRTVKHRPLASVPSLAEHPDKVPSLIGKRMAHGMDLGRVAACFIGRDCGECAAEIDWTRGPGG